MKMFLFIFIITTSYSALSSELVVRSKKLSYKLHFDQDSVKYNSMTAKIAVTKNKCNSESFLIFNRKLLSHLKKKVLSTNPKESLQLSFKEKSYQISDNSALAEHLYKMNKIVTAMKIQERAKCD